MVLCQVDKRVKTRGSDVQDMPFNEWLSFEFVIICIHYATVYCIICCEACMHMTTNTCNQVDKHVKTRNSAYMYVELMSIQTSRSLLNLVSQLATFNNIMFYQEQ